MENEFLDGWLHFHFCFDRNFRNKGGIVKTIFGSFSRHRSDFNNQPAKRMNGGMEAHSLR